MSSKNSNSNRSEMEKTKKKETKKYCDRNFKQQLAKALKANCGEPENFDKIRSNKLLAQYDSQKIIEFTNNVAADIQSHTEQSITDSRSKEIFTLAKVLNDISGENKPQELPLLLKLNASTISSQGSLKSNEVNFGALNKFLYSAVSGLPDFVEMNDVTKSVLLETYENLMSQVEKDAPEVLKKIRNEPDESNNSNFKELSNLIYDGSLNPFNISLDQLLKNKTSK
ncbi:hypothetical protein PVAND_003806 [Polypedilum vanderplanki]|uniref:Uncharacterized protein n=1 Tax=Polypedilum vanderplanki TaxID=319348 RepID=A0A9J6BVN8_POLVA|nr:hypothetical protein PVAND_003806 [Polypedilum vanderplanki]